LPIEYKGVSLNCSYRIDVLVGEQIVLEIKAVEHVQPVHLAQVITYLKLGGYPTGLLVNFNVTALKQGIRRLTREL